VENYDCKSFSIFGNPVYIADDEARKIMQTPDVIDAIKETFGTLFEGAKRDKLAEIVFSD
jgi:dephospho-CoA kinase